MEQLIKAAEIFVKERFKEEVTGHDWLHMERVRRQSSLIWEKEKIGDPLYVDLVALLHDVDDRKLAYVDHALTLKDWLVMMDVQQDLISKLLTDTSNISFRKGNHSLLSPEALIVQDADRLDALGATGISRAFAYGAKNGQMICKEGDFTEQNQNGGTDSTVAHFYDKLLLLKDRMNTKTGREMAEQRHRFMRSFLCQFEKEWKE